MIFLSLNYDKKKVCSKEIAAFCALPVKSVTALLGRLQRTGLVPKFNEDEEALYFLGKPPYDTRLAEIIFPVEPILFTEYIGKERGRLPGNQARPFYQRFRPFQYTMEKKLKRCQLSDWVVMQESDLYSF